MSSGVAKGGGAAPGDRRRGVTKWHPNNFFSSYETVEKSSACITAADHWHSISVYPFQSTYKQPK